MGQWTGTNPRQGRIETRPYEASGVEAGFETRPYKRSTTYCVLGTFRTTCLVLEAGKSRPISSPLSGY